MSDENNRTEFCQMAAFGVVGAVRTGDMISAGEGKFRQRSHSGTADAGEVDFGHGHS